MLPLSKFLRKYMSSLNLGLGQPQNTSLGLSRTQEEPNMNLGLTPQATTNLGLGTSPSLQEASPSVLVDDISSLLSSASLELRNQNYPDLADIVDSISEIYHYGL